MKQHPNSCEQNFNLRAAHVHIYVYMLNDFISVDAINWDVEYSVWCEHSKFECTVLEYVCVRASEQVWVINLYIVAIDVYHLHWIETEYERMKAHWTLIATDCVLIYSRSYVHVYAYREIPWIWAIFLVGCFINCVILRKRIEYVNDGWMLQCIH